MPAIATRTVNGVAALLCGVFLLLLAAAYGTANGWVIDAAGKPVAKDFINFYSAGSLVREGRPAAPYDWDAHAAAHARVAATDNPAFFPWPYPPTFLPVAEALAGMPYAVAWMVFAGGTFLLAAVAVVLAAGRPAAALWLGGSAATFYAVYVGQNGLLSTALLGFGLVWMRPRPVAAGACFGLLAYKPQLGVLLPLVLIAAGAWRAFVAAAVTVAGTGVAALAVYGAEPWVAFVAQLARVGQSGMAGGGAAVAKFQSVFGALHASGAGSSVALAVHIVVALAVAAATVLVWRRADVDDNLKAAALVVATALMSPYLFVYDLPLLTLAAAFLVAHGGATGGGLARVDGLQLLAANALVFAFPFLDWPTGLVATLLLGVMVMARLPRRVGADAGERAAGAGDVAMAGR